MKGRVRGKKRCSPEHWEMEILAPEAAASALPGQFLHLLCGQSPGELLYAYLRRPLSIYWADRERGVLGLLFRASGAGTGWLAEREEGEEVDFLGPLGRAFPFPREGEAAILVGGGVGIPPLFFLARELVRAGREVRAYIGARRRDLLLGVEEFRRLGVEPVLATDDGSLGERGTVMVPLERDWREGRWKGQVYACGPPPLVRAVAGLFPDAYVSLEERMACGVGACRGCAVPARGGGYRLVCVEGPVFPAREVELG